LGVADRSRILAVGDSLRTDIAGADAAGLDSLFVVAGIHATEFGISPGNEPDLPRIEQALAAGPYRPVAITRRLAW
jgi:ribonucleotide monophosphatase NagD (HAD superfamily)